MPRKPASWPCGRLPPVGPIGSGRITCGGRSVFRPAQICQGTADVRRVDPAGKQPARLQHLVPRVVHRRGRVVTRADDRELVGHLGMPRQDLRDLEAPLRRDRLERPANLRRRRPASGSNVSIWLGAPRLKIMMTERSSCSLLTRPSSLAAARPGSDRPMAPKAPASRKSRRVTPSHVCAVPTSVSLSMAQPSADWPDGWRVRPRSLRRGTVRPRESTPKRGQNRHRLDRSSLSRDLRKINRRREL